MAEIVTEITAAITKEINRRLQPLLQSGQRLLGKWHNPAQASFELGCTLLARGLYKEALWRFKFTLWRQPQRAGAWYNAALCHFALGDKTQGIAALKHSLTLNPRNETALYLLSTLEDGRYADNYHPHTTPIGIIKGEFAARAAEYDSVELGARGYIGHYSLYQVLSALLREGDARPCQSVLDAGCGTGLLGDLLRAFCQTLTGIDLSPEMLAKARKRKRADGKKLYDALLEGDLRAHLLQQNQPVYDYILASDVAPILGGLAPMVDGAARALHPKGALIFNVFLSEAEAGGYQLLTEEQRFIHSEPYLKQIAEKAGLSLRRFERKPFYSNRSAWVAVMQKNG